MSKYLIFFSFSLILVTSCKSEVKKIPVKRNVTEEEVQVVKKTQGDDLVKTTVKSKTPIKEQKENLAKITSQFGEQWDFCSCVKANDSINVASQKEMNDGQFDRFMKRWDEIEKKCKAFLTVPNTTPEERDLHEAKVKRCLSKK